MATREKSTSRVPTRQGIQPDHQLPPATRDGTGGGPGDDGARRSISDMVRDLAEDTRTLVRQEIELAKLEVSRTIKGFAIDSIWIAAGGVIATLGLICLVLAAALGLGALLDSYWLGTLITGAALILIAALVAWKGARGISRRDPRPTRTMESLREDADWAKREMDEFRNELSGSRHDAP